MDRSPSECNSGCESGWTAYLEQSSNSVYNECRKHEKSKKVVLQEDKDLSMVSDASSGPRNDENHVEEDYDSFRYYSYSVSAPEEGKMRKHKSKNQKNQDGGKLLKGSHLDDTASSPVFSFSKKNLALSSNQASTQQEKQGFSTTHSKRKSSLKQQHSGSLKPSVSGNEASNASG
ncbi:Angiogenin-2 like [Heracleum sosnowskyi]|uniref:Angiogenin-2 like n=1 Tax=Heracleum sosnowskyi TaxID=360622 RepID=A0AAD8MZG1_9APIA|nr:Angiogenin-2 like [Heracleum sosnowskyi]